MTTLAHGRNPFPVTSSGSPSVPPARLTLPVDVEIVCAPGPARDDLVRALTMSAAVRVRVSAVPGPARQGVTVLRSVHPAQEVRALLTGPAPSAVLVVSPPADDAEVVRTLQAGATSYLIENQFDVPEFFAATLGTAAGRSHLSPGALAAVVRRLRQPGQNSHQPELLESLSARERQIMDLVAAGRTNPAIAQAEFITEKTVRNHLNNIYVKLGVRSRSEAILVWLGRPLPADRRR